MHISKIIPLLLCATSVAFILFQTKELWRTAAKNIQAKADARLHDTSLVRHKQSIITKVIESNKCKILGRCDVHARVRRAARVSARWLYLAGARVSKNTWRNSSTEKWPLDDNIPCMHMALILKKILLWTKDLWASAFKDGDVAKRRRSTTHATNRSNWPAINVDMAAIAEL